MKSYSIVGQQHQPNSDQILAALEPGETVVLVREPDNKFDKNAVAVYVGGSKVGYIPSKQNAALAAFIDQTGQPFDSTARADADGKRTVVVTGGRRAGKTAAMEVLKAAGKSIDAKFARSPNSRYPMVEV